MKRVLIGLLLLLGLAFGARALFGEATSPEVSGTMCPTEHIIVDGKCVPVSDPEPEVVVMPEPIMVEEPVMEEPVVPAYEPLAFNGRLSAFAAANKGMIVKLKGSLDVSKFGVRAKKGVIVNSDVYFKAKDGNLYVIHKGELIKLN